MPSTINFIDTVIRSLEPGSSRKVYWCNGCPGFGLRVTPAGKKTFVFKYMSSRKSRWLTIGKYPEWSIRQARHQYDQYYDQVYEYGRDPVAEIQQDAEKSNGETTVSLFIDEYLEQERLKGKASVEIERKALERDVIPTIGEKGIDEVDPADIEAIQLRILKRAKRKVSATKDGRVAIKNTLAYVRQVFNLAVKRKLIETNPASEVESLGKSGKRDRVLSFKEIWLFWNGIEKTGTPPVTAKALKFALVTMQRSGEVRKMRYEAYKREEQVWQMEVHDTKNRTMHRVPISRYASDLIEQVRPFTGASPFVFGSTRAQVAPDTRSRDLQPLGDSAFSQVVRRSQESLGIHNVRPHDLRRTGATWITAVGLPKLYARLMLNHTDGERDVTGQVYVQYSYDFEKRRATQVWEFILDQIVTARNIDEIPDLQELRERVKSAGLI